MPAAPPSTPRGTDATDAAADPADTADTADAHAATAGGAAAVDGPGRDADPWVDGLLTWFDANARDLPWRSDRSFYRVWVAEVMLQQTRVETVRGYYGAFLARFPDVATLAAAELEDVLKAWEGLGYYRRARYLHRAAQHLADAGTVPTEAAALRDLPGFGPYTANAVAAFAFGRRVVPVDGNVRRVGARLFGLERPTPAAVEARLNEHQPAERPAAFAEALIELGATVCTPRAPRCDACPLAGACTARAVGAPEAFPDDPARRAVPTRRREALVFLDRNAAGEARVWLRRRAADELLPGLWGFPQRDAPPSAPARRPGAAPDSGGEVDGAPSGAAPRPDGDGRLEPIVHTYSHFRLELTAVRVDAPVDGTEPVDAAGLAARPLSRVDRRLEDAARAAGWPVPAPPDGPSRSVS